MMTVIAHTVSTKNTHNMQFTPSKRQLTLTTTVITAVSQCLETVHFCEWKCVCVCVFRCTETKWIEDRPSSLSIQNTQQQHAGQHKEKPILSDKYIQNCNMSLK